ncbi:SET domain-containing protein, partial [Trematosphaeria pertusa]
YLKTTLQDNAFRVGSTEKYLSKGEACVIATGHIAKGETIEDLYGRRIPLSSEELKKLVKAQKDFSVLDETRYCPTSLLVGPPHLINHSCNPNAKLEVMGDKCNVKVVALHHIAEGEEITISYGDEYFGNKNHDCLCEVC